MAACAYIHPGHHNIYAHSTDPYDPMSTNEEAWHSKTLSFAIEQGGLVKFVVCGGSDKESTYTRWALVKAEDECK